MVTGTQSNLKTSTSSAKNKNQNREPAHKPQSGRKRSDRCPPSHFPCLRGSWAFTPPRALTRLQEPAASTTPRENKEAALKGPPLR